MFLPLLFFTRVDVLDSALLGREAAVGADVLLVGFLRVLAVTDVLHHLAQTDELIADDLVVLVQSGLEDVALGQLQIADALGLGGENGTGHGTQALAQVVQTSADRQAVLGEGGLAAAVEAKQMADLIKYAIIVVSSAPIMCMYPLVQKYFNQGVMLGSLKG